MKPGKNWGGEEGLSAVQLLFDKYREILLIIHQKIHQKIYLDFL